MWGGAVCSHRLITATHSIGCLQCYAILRLLLEYTDEALVQEMGFGFITPLQSHFTPADAQLSLHRLSALSESVTRLSGQRVVYQTGPLLALPNHITQRVSEDVVKVEPRSQTCL